MVANVKNNRGFTLIELLIVVAILVIVACFVLPNSGCNNRGATEDRSREAAKKFVSENGIEMKRMSCAGDSDGDGYGSCTVVTKDGEKIYLECPCDYVDTKLFGASGCKEIEGQYKMNGRRGFVGTSNGAR